MRSFDFDGTVVELHATGSRITLSDGAVVTGEPHDTDSYRATALHHGYGDDTLLLCQEHELMHIALCHWLGIESPTMRMVSETSTAESALAGLEEDAVLAVQRFLRAAGIDFTDRVTQLQQP